MSVAISLINELESYFDELIAEVAAEPATEIPEPEGPWSLIWGEGFDEDGPFGTLYCLGMTTRETLRADMARANRYAFSAGLGAGRVLIQDAKGRQVIA